MIPAYIKRQTKNAFTTTFISFLLGAISIILFGCSQPESPNYEVEHSPEYTNLRLQILKNEPCDFASEIVKIRTSEPAQAPKLSMHAADADALTAWHYLRCEKYDSASFFGRMALRHMEALPDSFITDRVKTEAEMEFVMGVAAYANGDMPESFSHIKKTLEKSRSINYVDMQIESPLFLARVGCDIGDISSSLAQLRIAELVMDTANIAHLDYTQKLNYLTRASEIAIDLCDIRMADRTMAKASLFYDKASDLAKMHFLYQSTRLKFLYNEYSQASTTLNRVDMLMSKLGTNELDADALALQGLARSRMGELERAEQLASKAMASMKDNGIKSRNILYMLLGEIQILRHNKALAKPLLFDSLTMHNHTPFDTFVSHESQRSYYIASNDFEKAFYDLIEERRKSETLQNETFAFSDRKRDEVLRNIDESRSQELYALRRFMDQKHDDWQKQTIFYCIFFVLATLGLRWLIHYRERRTRDAVNRENVVLRNSLDDKIDELEQQAQKLEATNSRISDSIAYAEHIQHSMSPQPEKLNEQPISGSFIFYSPLDVVSGDFFWFTRRDDHLIICCADCTGHGVPGAFMSMISATIINDICDRLPRHQVDPALILEDLDRILISNLAHNRSETGASKDGLDISVCVLNLLSHKLSVAAARRPVVVVKENEHTTIRGTRRSIGDLDPAIRGRKFETTTIQMSKGDLFYMYTDGYSDQFGGQEGEKMHSSKVERFLSTMYGIDMDEQSLTIQELFTQWKGDYPQTDDVLFIGIQV